MVSDVDPLEASIAAQFAEAISKYKEAFIVGFVDFVHGNPSDPIQPLPSENWMKISAYELGYALAKVYVRSKDEED